MREEKSTVGERVNGRETEDSARDRRGEGEKGRRGEEANVWSISANNRQKRKRKNKFRN